MPLKTFIAFFGHAELISGYVQHLKILNYQVNSFKISINFKIIIVNFKFFVIHIFSILEVFWRWISVYRTERAPLQKLTRKTANLKLEKLHTWSVTRRFNHSARHTVREPVPLSGRQRNKHETNNRYADWHPTYPPPPHTHTHKLYKQTCSGAGASRETDMYQNSAEDSWLV